MENTEKEAGVLRGKHLLTVELSWDRSLLYSTLTIIGIPSKEKGLARWCLLRTNNHLGCNQMKLYWAVWFIHLPACVSPAWNTKWTGLATMYENKVHCLVNSFRLSTYLSSRPRKSDAPYTFSNYSAEIFPNVWLLLFALRNWQGWQAAANCLLYQTLRGWRVEAAFLHQTHVSSSLAVYIRWYQE